MRTENPELTRDDYANQSEPERASSQSGSPGSTTAPLRLSESSV